MKNSSLIVWGFPAIFWTIEYFTGNGAMQLLLLIWWGSISSFLTPFSFVIGPFAMLLGLSDWNTAWEAAFTKTDITLWSLFSFSFGGIGYYYFLNNWTEALLYYDEVLQERHEEIIQFGDESDDIDAIKAANSEPPQTVAAPEGEGEPTT